MCCSTQVSEQLRSSALSATDAKTGIPEHVARSPYALRLSMLNVSLSVAHTVSSPCARLSEIEQSLIAAFGGHVLHDR